jgi:hypothetical protein
MRTFRRKTRLSPRILKPIFENIPSELREHPYWAVWKKEVRGNGKISKPPINPNSGALAKVDDPNTFTSFSVAKKLYETGDYDGVGILITKDQSLLGVDIDNCISEGRLLKEAEDIIQTLETYAEKSPSGKGIRCIGKTPTIKSELNGCRKDNVELYTSKRFLTITGHLFNNKPVRTCYDAFKEVHKKYIANPRPREVDSRNSNISNSPLFMGNFTEFKSKSEADLALCRLIIKEGITQPDQIDMKFRESKLYDEKWERPDYRDQTIKKAIELEKKKPNTSKKGIDLLDTKKMITIRPPEIPWVIQDLIPEGQIGEMIGDGKIGKSSLLFQMAIAVALGIEKIPFFVNTPQRVLIVNVEDPPEQIHSRLYYQTQKFESIDRELLDTNLKVADGLGKIGPLMELATNKTPIQSEYGKQLEELILNIKPKLVILDTKSRLFGLEENNNDHATQWLFELEKIAREVNCSFLVAHHTGKGFDKSTGRGASAFDNNTRFRINLAPVDKSYASKFGIDDDDLNDFFQMTLQSNYSAKSKIHYFKRDETGTPSHINLGEQRWYNAEMVLYDLLKETSITRQELIRNTSDNAKKIRGLLLEIHKITAKECGILLDNLERKKKISYEKTSRGKGKIIVH